MEFLIKIFPTILEEWGIGINFILDYLKFHLEKIVPKMYALRQGCHGLPGL
jgi:hypothetical protein